MTPLKEAIDMAVRGEFPPLGQVKLMDTSFTFAQLRIKAFSKKEKRHTSDTNTLVKMIASFIRSNSLGKGVREKVSGTFFDSLGKGGEKVSGTFFEGKGVRNLF